VATIELRSSKLKALLITLGCLCFVVAGLWIVLFADEITFRGADRTEFNEFIGWLVVLFFGIGSIISGRLVLSSKVTVLIDSPGLTLMPSSRKKQFIPWDNIDSFSVANILSTKLIVVNLNNTQHWLENETNPIRKKLMQFNVGKVGSPFSFPASITQLSHAKLLQLLNEKLIQYRNGSAPAPAAAPQPVLIPSSNQSIATKVDIGMPITWSSSMKVWWSLFWRCALYGVVAGFFLGAIAGFFTELFGNSSNAAYNGMIAGYVGNIFASMLALKHALSKHTTLLSSANESAQLSKV
jgi:hypothetical protein